MERMSCVQILGGKMACLCILSVDSDCFSQVFSESIASVCGGTVGSSNYQEVVVATYGGRVFGLSREPVTPKPISQEVQAKLDSLKQVAVLEKGWEMEEGGRGSGEAEGKRWGGGRGGRCGKGKGEGGGR